MGITDIPVSRYFDIYNFLSFPCSERSTYCFLLFFSCDYGFSVLLTLLFFLVFLKKIMRTNPIYVQSLSDQSRTRKLKKTLKKINVERGSEDNVVIAIAVGLVEL